MSLLLRTMIACLLLFSAAMASAARDGKVRVPTIPGKESPVIEKYSLSYWGGRAYYKAKSESATTETLAAVNPIRIQFAAWRDGTVMWTGDAPGEYRLAQVAPQKIDALVADVKKLGEQHRMDSIRLSYYGPDSWVEFVVVNDERLAVQLSSWHEGYERNPKSVVTAQGIRSLNEGETKESVLAQQGADYREFRALWGDIDGLFDNFVKDLSASEAKPIDIEINWVPKATPATAQE